QTCCVADFPAFAFGFGAVASEQNADGQVGWGWNAGTRSKIRTLGRFETCDTADLEVCATRCPEPRLDFHTLSGLGLDDFDAGMTGVNLLLKPLPGIGLPMAEQNGARLHLADKVEQFLAV